MFLICLQPRLIRIRTFLQQGVIADERSAKGLHAAFDSVFPIKSHTGMAELQYVSYRLGTPSF